MNIEPFNIGAKVHIVRGPFPLGRVATIELRIITSNLGFIYKLKGIDKPYYHHELQLTGGR
jgi:hypothetical protein